MTALDRPTPSDVSTASNIAAPSPPRGPIQALIDLFSSVWFGIWLLVFLFIYCSIGSVGVWIPGNLGLADHHEWIHDIYWMSIPWTQIHLRQAPGLEMTEFEWFHWWVFDLNILLICINITVTTIRRIRFNIVNLGVWMIHSGIVILCIGSVLYFATKLEGEAPIVRRNLVIQVPDHPPVRIAAQPGSQMMIEGDREIYHFQIMRIDPQWELRSGEDEGEQAYTVMVQVSTSTQQFVRTLPAGYPEYVQDAIFTGDPHQPMVRAINEIGRPLVDESINLSLEYAPVDRFYLMGSAALYLREKGSEQWIERPINDLPRYNDYYQSPTDVWLAPRGGLASDRLSAPPLRKLQIEVPAVDERDPLADVPIYVDRYLLYAMPRTQRVAGGNEMDPAVRIRLRFEDRVHNYELIASDPMRNRTQNNQLAFEHVTSHEQLEALQSAGPATLTITVPEADFTQTVPAEPDPDGPFIDIEGTDYAYRLEGLDDLARSDGGRAPVALVRIRTPERTFVRWVVNRSDMPSRDVLDEPGAAMHDQAIELDQGIQMHYQPRVERAPVTFIAGPDDQSLHLMLDFGGDEPHLLPVQPGTPVQLQPNVSIEVAQYLPYSRSETRPYVEAPERRASNAGNQRSMIRVHVPVETGHEQWLQHQVFPFAHEREALRGFLYQPAEIQLADGRIIEMLYSRESHPLPSRIVLDDFQVTAHIGGFTGQTSSIRDWTSIIRFEEGDSWTPGEPVSVNKPADYGGFWFFQAKWDPPSGPRFQGDVPSAGLNFTVLGVGNRNGVWIQLAGCIIAVIGMCYAFYIKPLIKRRRQQAVYDALAARPNHSGGEEAST